MRSEIKALQEKQGEVEECNQKLRSENYVLEKKNQQFQKYTQELKNELLKKNAKMGLMEEEVEKTKKKWESKQREIELK